MAGLELAAVVPGGCCGKSSGSATSLGVDSSSRWYEAAVGISSLASSSGVGIAVVAAVFVVAVAVVSAAASRRASSSMLERHLAARNAMSDLRPRYHRPSMQSAQRVAAWLRSCSLESAAVVCTSMWPALQRDRTKTIVQGSVRSAAWLRAKWNSSATSPCAL